ncbi:helix-turn-helix domain-containing protein [Nisaea sediminum]|uniref:helix-turn-helix domain-containing protein n=1 Tax=Nisaea sediminum TaxID=2775867 RepID=UPI001867AEAB|nr:helix-turn-helix transcriptional regulator [Nisaea sediminum]
MTQQQHPIGQQLRDWRRRRRLSQLDLALEADISSKHLSFVETGRARPSREMILLLCERLAVPPREQNLLLLAGGYAPHFPARTLDDPSLAAARKAVEQVLSGHEPYPAVAVDRHWSLVSANRMIPPLLDGISPALLEPPVNVLRIALHPDGLAPRIRNLAEWRHHLLHRLRQQIEVSADAGLIELLQELESYPFRRSGPPEHQADYGGVFVPLELDTPVGTLSMFSTITVFGTPIDITLSELAIEAFFPADEHTADLLRTIAGS